MPCCFGLRRVEKILLKKCTAYIYRVYICREIKTIKMELITFSANQKIRVKLKDKGIELYVKTFNDIVPFKDNISFNEFKRQADELGYHKFTLLNFMYVYGNLKLCQSDYYNLDILFDTQDFKTFKQ